MDICCTILYYPNNFGVWFIGHVSCTYLEKQFTPILSKICSFIVPTEFRFQSHENEIIPGFIHSMMYICYMMLPLSISSLYIMINCVCKFLEFLNIYCIVITHIYISFYMTIIYA